MHEIKTVLALGAHPDDLELGCGGTLAKLCRRGIGVHAVILSDGSQGGKSEFDRTLESGAALKALGVATVTQYDFEDTRLHEALNDLIICIEEHVRALSPDRVYTMFHLDRHQDHRAVHEASVVACRSVGQILGYETPSSYPNFTPTLFEPIDAFIDAKIEALKLHVSQGDRLYMHQEKIRSAAHFRGVQVDLGQAEGFIPYKLVF
jgi:LmbE family N-acetylglucosaminyl deacetylase